MTKLTWIPSVLIVSLLAGCASPPPPPVDAPVSPAAAHYDATFEAVRRTLTDYRFRIDRVDRRAGSIETFPMTGKGWLEPWRGDGATMWDTSESTLQTIYRTATVRIVRSGAGAYDVRVRVAVARADRPSLQITNTSQAYSLFQLQRGRRWSRRGEGEQQRRRDPVPLDDDLVLAMFLKRDIEQRLAQR